MVVLTEELSAASLIAGSLLTRCEILSRALLVGGTERRSRSGCRSSRRARCSSASRSPSRTSARTTASVQCKATPAEGPSGRGLQDQRREGVGDVRGPRRRARAAGAHRAEPEQGLRGTVAVHRAEGAVVRPQVRVPAAGGRRASRARRSRRRAIAACTATSSTSRTTSCRPRIVVGEEGGLGRGIYLTLGGIAGRAAADRRAGARRGAGVAREGVPVHDAARAVREARSASSSSRSTGSG